MGKNDFQGVPRSFNAWRKARRRYIDYALRGIPPSVWKEKQVKSMHSNCQDKENNVTEEAESHLVAGMQQLLIDNGNNVGNEVKQQCKVGAPLGQENQEWWVDSKPTNSDKDWIVKKDLKKQNIIHGAKHESNHGGFGDLGDSEKLVSSVETGGGPGGNGFQSCKDEMMLVKLSY